MKANLVAIVLLVMLQQYLPFTVLKHNCFFCDLTSFITVVATVLTVYGIETTLSEIDDMYQRRMGCNSTYH